VDGAGGRPQSGVGLDHEANQVAQLSRIAGCPCELALGDFPAQFLYGLAGKGLLEVGEFVEQAAEGPDVGFGVVGQAQPDLGRGVGEGASAGVAEAV
jgi:hypothetical protein